MILATLYFLFSLPAAAIYFDVNALYYTDGLTHTATATHTRTLVDAAIGFGVNKRKTWVVGWNYASLSTSDVDSVTTSYASTDMGLKFGYFFSKRKTLSLFLTYNLQTTCTFSTAGGANEEWRGTSIKAEFGHHLWVSEGSNVTLRLNYYQATLAERITGGSALTSVGYSRNFIYPSIGYMMLF